MKMFTKLALVSSMAISANAMAMQSMDDAALSAATGQDGINIGIGISKIEIEKVLIHDNNGLTNATLGGTSTAGAIVIKGNGTGLTATNGVVITAPMLNATTVDNTRALASHNLADLTIDTDAGTGTNGAFLNVAAAVSGLDIYIGEIGVSGSNTAGSTVRRGNDAANYNKILSGLTIKTGVMNANIQLGAAPQGAMIVLNTTMQGGLEIKDLGIVDSSTKTGTADGTAGNRAAGQIYLDSIRVSDANANNLTVNAAVSVVGKEDTNNGYLRIVTGSGATTPKTDMYIKGVHLGSQTAGSIGDVEVQGMQTYYFNGTTNVPGSVITISGH
ncbi:MAG: pilus assembly protein FilA [Acinetobacter sp.]